VIVLISAAEDELLERAAQRFGRRTDGVATFVRAPGTIAFVAAEGDDVHGWCWGYLLPRPDGTSMLYLHNLEVAEHCRRRGTGRGLLRAFIAAGIRLGAARMFLTTGEDNTAARRLYESMGAGLATQGPTVSYWFRLSGREQLDDRAGAGRRDRPEPESG
jgi:ribosomal protein S18 acetylase RimI-like enzyme